MKVLSVQIIEKCSTFEDYVKQLDPMSQKAHSLTREERMHICDMGFFNDTIKGYLIEAMRLSGYDREQIQQVLDHLKWVFDDRDAEGAAKIYQEF